MGSRVDGKFKTFTAQADVKRGRFVKLGSSSGTEVLHASLANYSIGIAEHDATSGNPVTVRLHNGEGTVKIEAEGVIAVGNTVGPTYAGKATNNALSGTPTYINLEAAGSAGDYMECVLKKLD